MHPKIQHEKPGSCPKCGMALDPMTLSLGMDESELKVEDAFIRFLGWTASCYDNFIPGNGTEYLATNR